MSMINDFDKIVKEKLGSVEQAPPAYMWDKIAAEIVAPVAKVPFYSTNSFKLATTAAVLLLIVGLTYFSLPHQVENKSVEISKTEPGTAGTNAPALPMENRQFEENTMATTTVNSALDTISPNQNQDLNTSSQKPVKEGKVKTPQKQLVEHFTASEQIGIEQEAPKTNIESDQLVENQGFVSESVTGDEKTATNLSIAELEPKSEVLPQEIIEDKPKGETMEELMPAPESYVSKPTTPQEEVAPKSEKPTSEELLANIPHEINQVPSEGATTKKPQEDFHTKHARNMDKYGFGIHYGMELINAKDISLTSNNLDFSFNFQNLNFIFQTGVGMQYSRDNRYYNMEYMRHDFVKSETRFDSAVFVTDTAGIVHIVPVDPYRYDVYDSVNHKHNASFYETYYNLRIPMMLGYQKDFKNIGFFAKGGIIYSLVVTQQRSAIFQPDEASRMLSVNYDNQSRKRSQIEYALALGFVYRLSHSLHIHAELMTKYYQYSVYDNAEFKNLNPWSVEGRVGLVYLLN